MPSWVLAIFLSMAAAVPVGVVFTATLNLGDQTYTYSGQGTYGAPAPIAGAGIPPLLLAGGAYMAWRQRRRKKN